MYPFFWNEIFSDHTEQKEEHLQIAVGVYSVGSKGERC